MDITLYVKEQPGGRCRLYQAYAEALVEAGANVEERVDNDMAAAILINDQQVFPEDGVFITAADIQKTCEQRQISMPKVNDKLDAILEQCLSEWE